MPEADVVRVIRNAPQRYKIYAIPKRRGMGWRIIAQPSRELKDIQRYLVSHALSSLPIHGAATAYVAGKSIRQNALMHAKNRVILKLDFEGFFHSIVFADLAVQLERMSVLVVERSDWSVLEKLLFWHNPETGNLCLSIGAPSSPFISNAVMYQLDAQISEIVAAHGAAYTRYADDISISSDTVETLREIEAKISGAVAASEHPRLRFNLQKTGIYTKAVRRIVTGLTITPQGRVSLGRKRKREISAAIHHIQIERNTSHDHWAKTRGWLAFASSVEPYFFRSLQRKYGNIVSQILRSPIGQ
jgi:hypothetical protein